MRSNSKENNRARCNWPNELLVQNAHMNDRDIVHIPYLITSKPMSMGKGLVNMIFFALKQNRTIYIKQKTKPDRLWTLKPFKPNHLRKGKPNRLGKILNQTEPFNKQIEPSHLNQTN